MLCYLRFGYTIFPKQWGARGRGGGGGGYIHYCFTIFPQECDTTVGVYTLLLHCFTTAVWRYSTGGGGGWYIIASVFWKQHYSRDIYTDASLFYHSSVTLQWGCIHYCFTVITTAVWHYSGGIDTIALVFPLWCDTTVEVYWLMLQFSRSNVTLQWGYRHYSVFPKQFDTTVGAYTLLLQFSHSSVTLQFGHILNCFTIYLQQCDTTVGLDLCIYTIASVSLKQCDRKGGGGGREIIVSVSPQQCDTTVGVYRLLLHSLPTPSKQANNHQKKKKKKKPPQILSSIMRFPSADLQICLFFPPPPPPPFFFVFVFFVCLFVVVASIAV